MSVVTVDEAKVHLNIGAVTTFNAELQTFLDGVEGALGMEVGPLGAVAKTERVRGCRRVLQLNYPPVILLTTVTATDGTVVSTSLLTPTSHARVEYLQGGWFPARFYDVVYQAGRSSLPSDLRLAVLELLRWVWDPQRGGGAARFGSMPAETLSNTLLDSIDEWPTRVEQILKNHKPILGA